MQRFEIRFLIATTFLDQHLFNTLFFYFALDLLFLLDSTFALPVLVLVLTLSPSCLYEHSPSCLYEHSLLDCTYPCFACKITGVSKERAKKVTHFSRASLRALGARALTFLLLYKSSICTSTKCSGKEGECSYSQEVHLLFCSKKNRGSYEYVSTSKKVRAMEHKHAEVHVIKEGECSCVLVIKTKLKLFLLC